MVSNIGDQWGRQLPERWPDVVPSPSFPPPASPSVIPWPPLGPVSREEFEALRKEMEELKQLLQAAKRFDEATGQPDCHMDEKVKLIKAVAKMVGVDLGDVFETAKSKV